MQTHVIAGHHPSRSGREIPCGFIATTFAQFECPAYRSLTCHARALLMEIKAKYDGRNNGDLVLSLREAMERIGCSKKTAQDAFAALVERGFIRESDPTACTQVKRWTLTERPVESEPPSADFLRWRPE